MIKLNYCDNLASKNKILLLLTDLDEILEKLIKLNYCDNLASKKKSLLLRTDLDEILEKLIKLNYCDNLASKNKMLHLQTDVKMNFVNLYTRELSGKFGSRNVKFLHLQIDFNEIL